ncbi:MAG TPA: hypothetical protein VN616_07220 [Puia sp.]|nr:hypothetical protein [Puia sp.]
MPKTLADTVDLSQMDTARQITIPCPVNDYVQIYYLVGLMDSTDISTAVLLYDFFDLGAGSASFAYPPKYVQKYETQVWGESNDKSEQFIYYNYSDSVPGTIEFQDNSKFTLVATTNSDFRVTFNGSKPSYYNTAWSAGPVSFDVYESPDSTLQALSLLKSLHSRMLAGQDLSGLTLVNFNFETATGYGFLDFFNYACNPSRIQTYSLPYESEYFKSF